MDLREYLVRGATLICTNGSHKRKINLPKCHGIYAGVHPLLHGLECLTESMCGKEKCNITHFGVCCPQRRESAADRDDNVHKDKRKQ